MRRRSPRPPPSTWRRRCGCSRRGRSTPDPYSASLRASRRRSPVRPVSCGLTQAGAPDASKLPPKQLREAMIEKHLPLIDEAGKRGVRILCLQEIFTGPYFCAEQDPKWYQLAERVPDGPTIKLMQERAKRFQMAMVVPVYEEEMTGVYYNT